MKRLSKNEWLHIESGEIINSAKMKCGDTVQLVCGIDVIKTPCGLEIL